MRDMKSNIAAQVAVSPEVLAGNKTGPAIDLRDCNRMAFVITTGAIAGSGSFTAKVQEADTSAGGDFADADAQWIDSDAALPLEGDSAYRIGYHGHKRFVRLVLTKASGTSIAASAVAVMGDLAERPV
ncbi:hypothetical protein [uncultured Jannaschia sp.]|uniref:hypothetical protein n=1 Tax=uncultured Jannaschia sp. TaxID=293347 RepID=UPI002635CC19|nr:hypothetical protein [uncultured Jannaschia sp.]